MRRHASEDDFSAARLPVETHANDAPVNQMPDRISVLARLPIWQPRFKPLQGLAGLIFYHYDGDSIEARFSA